MVKLRDSGVNDKADWVTRSQEKDMGSENQSLHTVVIYKFWFCSICPPFFPFLVFIDY